MFARSTLVVHEVVDTGMSVDGDRPEIRTRLVDPEDGMWQRRGVLLGILTQRKRASMT